MSTILVDSVLKWQDAVISQNISSSLQRNMVTIMIFVLLSMKIATEALYFVCEYILKAQV